MINSKVLGKPYQRRANYEVQINVFVEKQKQKLDEIENQINNETNSDLKLNLQHQRNAAMKNIRLAKEEPFAIVEE